MPLLLALVVLFVLVPLAELAIILQVGQSIGVWATIGILVADSVLGSLLMRSQGRAVWRRFNAALRTGGVPATEVLDGGLVIFGGACLLTPGFITDLFGLLLLLPPTRAVIRRLLVRRFASQMAGGVARDAFRRAGAPPPPRRPEAEDVEGTAHDVDDRGPRP